MSNRDHDRRSFLKASALGLFTTSVSGWPELLAAKAAVAKARPRSCIVLWTDGGLSQQDTFDMKPDAADTVRGEFKPIATSVPGVQFGELLPKLAKQANDLAILRSIYSSEGSPSHPLGGVQLHTEGLAEGFRGKRPCLGGVLSSCLATPDLALPPHLVLGAEPVSLTATPFSAKYGPVVLRDGSVDGLRAMTRPAVADNTFAERYGLLRELDKGFGESRKDPLIETHHAGYERALELMRSPKLRDLDLERVPANVRESFGANRVGKGCLLASLLVEAGVPFVEVKWNINVRTGTETDVTLKAWDTHSDNFRTLKHYLPILDAALSSLLTRLKERGLLDSTLVVCMGEMGRTPRVNKKAGRDHFGRAWSVALAGAGIKGGQVVGASTADGDRVKDRPIKVPDLMATVCKAVGVDPASEVNPRTGERIDPDNVAQRMTPGLVRLVAKAANPVQEVLR